MTEEPTIQHAKFDEDAADSAAFVLVVAGGPDAGRQLRVDGASPGPSLVGQSEVCALRLGDRGVSRRHAAFEVVDGHLRVTDLGSTNGTCIGGVRIGNATLQGGEVLLLGETRIEVARLSSATMPMLPDTQSFGRVVGASLAMRRLYPMLERLAASDIPVVIEGESGTGKEVLAEALHERGPRAAGPFVVFDCTAVPPSLIEAELFGHEAGAFTGAVHSRAGFFEQAHGGTLLIDEIGDLDPHLQPKLLRVIERAEVRRVGGAALRRVNVRILAATRRDLDQEVQQGRFRDDLFHRLAVARVELPPLRERRGDILLLARLFWAQLGGASSELPARVVQRWEEDPWPGNVRALRNAVARVMALGDTAPAASPTTPSRVPRDFIEELLEDGLPLPIARKRLREEFERRYVARMLAQHHGNVSKAAAASGIARRYFQQVHARTKR